MVIFKRFLILSISIIFLLANTVQAQDKPAYVLYDGKGKKVSYQQMIKKFKKADVILFGEYHDNPISHWLELEVAKDLEKLYDLTLGAEMIEADNQDQLNAYLSVEISAAQLDSAARLWNNYKTDYKPLVDLAKDSSLNFIATNIPRRYARMVSKGGFEALDSLGEQELSWMPPLPMAFDPELPQYKKIMTMMAGHGSPDMIKAQAIKDATMAHFILQNVPAKKRFKKSTYKFLHFNGAYHSDFHEGIGWYLNHHNKKLKVQTISTVMVDDPKIWESENAGRADYIICIDSDMTRTY